MRTGGGDRGGEIDDADDCEEGMDSGIICRGSWNNRDPPIGGNLIPPGIEPGPGENNEGDDWWCLSPLLPTA